MKEMFSEIVKSLKEIIKILFLEIYNGIKN